MPPNRKRKPPNADPIARNLLPRPRSPSPRAPQPPARRRATGSAVAGHLLPPLQPHATLSHRSGHRPASPAGATITAHCCPSPACRTAPPLPADQAQLLLAGLSPPLHAGLAPPGPCLHRTPTPPSSATAMLPDHFLRSPSIAALRPDHIPSTRPQPPLRRDLPSAPERPSFPSDAACPLLWRGARLQILQFGENGD
ncbi:hypothetical protein VPH35_013288 [Triticum aestivum]